MKKILINRTDAIGDTLLTTALARAIKSLSSHYEVHFLVSQRCQDIINHCDGVDKSFVLQLNDNRKQQKEFLKKLFRQFSYDYYFHLGGSFLPTLYAFLKRVPVRSGILSKVGSYVLLNAGLRQSRSLVKYHEVDYNLEFLKVLGLNSKKLSKDQYIPKLNNIPRGKRSGDYIVVHPGMTGHTLNWPMECYGNLCERLRKKHQVIISYTPSDRVYIDELKSILKDSVEYYDGTTEGIVAYASLVKGAKLFIGPSTGTTHIAASLGTPQVALYSPIKVQSEKRWGPVRCDKNFLVFSPPEGYDSMTGISVDDVYHGCETLLMESST